MTRFGVQLPYFSGVEAADLFEHVAGLATAAEDAGFDSVWVMDHFFQLRNPALPAKSVTTLDVISGSAVRPPHEVPEPIKGHIEAGPDEVIFSVAFADAAAIGALAEPLSAR